MLTKAKPSGGGKRCRPRIHAEEFLRRGSRSNRSASFLASECWSRSFPTIGDFGPSGRRLERLGATWTPYSWPASVPPNGKWKIGQPKRRDTEPSAGPAPDTQDAHEK